MTIITTTKATKAKVAILKTAKIKTKTKEPNKETETMTRNDNCHGPQCAVSQYLPELGP